MNDVINGKAATDPIDDFMQKLYKPIYLWAKDSFATKSGVAANLVITLNAAPTSSTLTYTKDGKTVNFEVGQYARVANAQSETGYDFYQLQDISVTNEGEANETRTAAWYKLKNATVIVEGGGSFYTPTLQSAPTSSTLTYTKDGETIDFEIGQFCRVADQTMDAGYKFYQLYDIASNGTVAVWQEMGTPLERVTIAIGANANVNALRSASPTVTVRSTKSGLTLLSQPWTGDNITLKVEPGDTYTVECEDVEGFATPATAEQSYTADFEGTRSFNLTYQTTGIQIGIESNQGSDSVIGALRATVSWTYNGEDYSESNVADGDTVYVPIGVTPTITFPNAPTGYSRSISSDGLTATYSAEVVTVTVSSDDFASVEGQKVLINGTENTVPASGVVTQKIPFGTEYSVSVNSKSGYVSPSAQGPYTAEQTSRSVAFQYVKIMQGEVTIVPTAKTLSYTGSDQTLINAGEGTGTMYYKLNDGEYSTVLPSATNAGTYTIKYKAAASTYYSESPEGELTVTIAKVAPIYTAPTAKTGLVYSGSAQALLNAGSTSHGTIQYSADNENWGTPIPTSTNAAASIDVYWRLVGDQNHTDVSSATITCSIAKANISLTVNMNGWTYGGTASNPSVNGNSGSGAVTYYYKVNGADDSTYTSTKPSNAGTYVVKAQVAETSNYNSGTATKTFTIAQASRTISFTTAPTKVEVGKTASIAASPSVGGGTVSYSSSNTSVATVSGNTITGVGAGTCSITATVTASGNYKSASASYTLTVEATGFVDLGLSVKWARANIVKTSDGKYKIGENPEDYGCYFSWGNIVGHNSSNGSTFDDGYSFSESNYNNSAGKSVSANIASNDSAHDAALATLKSPWRLPTSAEFVELCNNTDQEYTQINGVNGLKFMKKTDHSKFIFLPSSGRGGDTTVRNFGSNGRYWSSTYRHATYAYNLYFTSNSIESESSTYRSYGFTIRAVQ